MAGQDMFRAPLQLGMRSLDRAKFQRVVPLKAARIFENKNISRVRGELEKSKDALQQDRVANVHADADPERAEMGKKCVLLRPESVPPKTASGFRPASSEADDSWPYSHVLAELEKQSLISVVPFNLHLDYSYWTYHDIISSILPEDEQGEIPSGFSQVGHVAHLNLRDEYLKYKHLIAEILMDKNPGVRTVINKIDDVGEENEYRTFKYEVLAGPDDMNVVISEENCIFRFDYSKVYWNTRLNTEHRRLVDVFQPGEAVCDLMAGIGPFAVPAGKKGVFVWANDLNPDSFHSLDVAIKRNKVADYVHAFNDDGKSFIKKAVAELATTDHKVEVTSRPSRKDPTAKPEVLRVVAQPRTFQHFVLNLPASAITFLSGFVGMYPLAVRENLPSDYAMPLIHVYCFSTKSNDNVEEGIKICQEISEQIGFAMRPGQTDREGCVEIFDVRDVAPKKRMFCATFRLPKEVAFRET